MDRDSSPLIDTTVPHAARRYDYLLGGKDNFAADRASAELLLQQVPTLRTAARANRFFMQRAVRWLVAEKGVRQILDIGTGLPTRPNAHEVAQGIAASARVVYVDNDPLVLVHARALLASHPAGETAYIHGDLRDPASILHSDQLTKTLDLTRPVALMCIAIMHFIPEQQEDQLRDSLRALVAALAPGSFFVFSHGSDVFLPDAQRMGLGAELNKGSHGDSCLRSEAQLRSIIDDAGLELVEPGIVPVVDWHRELASAEDDALGATAAQAMCWAGVARRR